jgi:hypothetical protein
MQLFRLRSSFVAALIGLSIAACGGTSSNSDESSNNGGAGKLVAAAEKEAREALLQRADQADLRRAAARDLLQVDLQVRLLEVPEERLRAVRVEQAVRQSLRRQHLSLTSRMAPWDRGHHRPFLQARLPR